MNSLITKIKNRRTSHHKTNCKQQLNDHLKLQSVPSCSNIIVDEHKMLSPTFSASKLKLSFDDENDLETLNARQFQVKGASTFAGGNGRLDVEPQNTDLGASTSCYSSVLYRPSRLQLDLKDTLTDPTSLGYVLTYMESKGLRHLVKFWLDAETFRVSSKAILDRLKNKTDPDSNLLTLIEQDAVAIFAKYLSKESSHNIGLTDQLRNDIINKICCEDGQLDIDCFVEAQNFILNIMQIRYYPEYLGSALYCKHVLEVLDQRHDLSITDVLYDETCLFHFVEFMEQEGELDLIEFWLTSRNFHEKVTLNNKMENAQEETYQSCRDDAMVLYNKYLSLQSPRRLKVLNDELRRNVENEICKAVSEGPNGACFDQACKVVLNVLEKDYLPKFVNSKLFVKLYEEVAAAARDELDLPGSSLKKRRNGSVGCSESSDSSLKIGDWTGERPQWCKANNSTVHSNSNLPRILTDDPDSLWKRQKTKLTLGHIDGVGNYITDAERPEEIYKRKKIDSKVIKAKMKNMLFGDKKEQELMADQVAAIIVQDIQNLTMQAAADVASPF